MNDGLSIAEAAKSSYLPIVAGLFRGILGIASAFGFTWALAVTADQVTMAATAAVMLATLIWSAWQKIAAIREARAAAVAAAKASAISGQPVLVAVTPPGEPNVAIPISGPELRAAPSAPVFPAGSMTTAELNQAEAGRR